MAPINRPRLHAQPNNLHSVPKFADHVTATHVGGTGDVTACHAGRHTGRVTLTGADLARWDAKNGVRSSFW